MQVDRRILIQSWQRRPGGEGGGVVSESPFGLHLRRKHRPTLQRGEPVSVLRAINVTTVPINMSRLRENTRNAPKLFQRTTCIYISNVILLSSSFGRAGWHTARRRYSMFSSRASPPPPRGEQNKYWTLTDPARTDTRKWCATMWILTLALPSTGRTVGRTVVVAVTHAEHVRHALRGWGGG